MASTKLRGDDAQPRRKRGRPPAGDGGQKVSDWGQTTLRLPDTTRQLLMAIGGMTGLPAWRIIERALQAYVQRLPDEDRRALAVVRSRRSTEG